MGCTVVCLSKESSACTEWGSRTPGPVFPGVRIGGRPPLPQSRPWTMLCFLFFVFPPCKRPARSHKASAARTRPARAPPRAPARPRRPANTRLPSCAARVPAAVPTRLLTRPVPRTLHGPLCDVCAGDTGRPLRVSPQGARGRLWLGWGWRAGCGVLGSSLAGSRSPRIADSPAGPLPSCPLRLGGACDGSPGADRNSGGRARSRPWGAWGFPCVRRVPG